METGCPAGRQEKGRKDENIARAVYHHDKYRKVFPQPLALSQKLVPVWEPRGQGTKLWGSFLALIPLSRNQVCGWEELFPVHIFHASFVRFFFTRSQQDHFARGVFSCV